MSSELPPQNPRQDCGQGYYRAVSSIPMDSGYTGSKLLGSYRVAEGGATAGNLITYPNRLRNHTNFSSLGILSQTSSKVENKNGDNSSSSFGYWSNDAWYDAENGIKREMDGDPPLFVASQSAAAEIGAMRRLLHFQDTVSCKVRAKRGCATHPRSIAERVRRTRISEGMRKLQDLVPSIDKQTNTADMLDFAVEYIKSLQKQYRALSEIHANCKCSASAAEKNS